VIGNAINDSVRADTDFNDCMLANGWQIADQGAPLPAPPVASHAPPQPSPGSPYFPPSVVERPVAALPVALAPVRPARDCVPTASGGEWCTN
jgi:hypothetical protein